MSKLTVVVENTASIPNLLAEHGLSLWLEHKGKNLLYDTGAGNCLMPNLEILGFDIKALDGVILSHGHHDHAGGLARLLKARQDSGFDTPVWGHEDVFSPHLKQMPDGSLKDVAPKGHDRAAYEKLGAKFIFVDGTETICPGLTLMAPIERVTDFEGPAPTLVTLENDKVVDDPFWDDLSMIIEDENGLSVISGCAHSGVINVLLAAEKFKQKPVDLVLGGTHLGPAPKEQQDRALAELQLKKGLKVAAGHCTGPKMQEKMSEMLNERYLGLSGGMVFNL